MNRTVVEKIYGRAFLHFIDTGLIAGERPIDAAPAISEEVAKIDRSDREGTLGITNLRVVFIAKHSGRDWHRYGLLNVVSAHLEKATIGNKFLILALEEGRSVRFMVGTKQGKRLLPALQSAMKSARELDARMNQLKAESAEDSSEN